VFPKVGAALLGNARAITKVPCAMDNNMMAVAPLEGDSRYWYYVMCTVDMDDLNLSGTIPFVSDTAVRDLVLPVDRPASEQRRIADFLDDQVARIDNIISGRRQQLRRVIAARESAVFDSVIGATNEDRRPSGLSWAETLPADWGSTRLTHVARMGTGHTPSRSVGEYWIDCTIPWLTTSDVHRFRHDEIDQITDTGLHISKLGLANSAAVLHPTGTVALSRTASAGFSIVMGIGMATSQDYATWTCGPKINNVYLLWCLRAMRRDVMGRLATGSTHKTIYFPDLMSIRVPLPPVADQLVAVAEIGALVDAERQRSAAITRSIELFQELKKSLITAAVMGEFDVSTANGSKVSA
jgi:type I restriction enzyme S subunit